MKGNRTKKRYLENSEKQNMKHSQEYINLKKFFESIKDCEYVDENMNLNVNL